MNIGLLGMGTVGGGVYNAIVERDLGLSVKRILDCRALPGLEKLQTAAFQTILDDPSIDLVVETMGGDEPAFGFVLAALNAHKHVVTSNKLLVSAHYRELHEAAAQNGVQFRYTAAAGGGIPWLYNLARAKRCDDILSIQGVINGTTNFILDGMYTQNGDFDEMLSEAQRLGYAERDPSADIDALDTQRKCALSASLAFDAYVPAASIPTAGIRHITKEDIAYCKNLGRVCRLMFYASRADEGVCAQVEPVFVPGDSAAATIRGCGNMITLTGKHLGELTMIGQGAGREPTGVAVVQDILDIAQGLIQAPFSTAEAAVCATAPYRYYVRKDGAQYVSEPISAAQIHKEGADFFARIAE
ncbi:MAG: homoserine dehydrogenase [Eubacteriales bacterium]|nr:homoserine dehydrogenase [Eubacteriales bacterium]